HIPATSARRNLTRELPPSKRPLPSASGPSARRTLTLHLDAGVVEAGAAADIGQGVGDEDVRRESIPGLPAPEPLGQDDRARPDRGANLRPAAHLAPLVPDAHVVAVLHP